MPYPCCCDGPAPPECCDPPYFEGGTTILSVTSDNCSCIDGDYELENIGPNIWQLNVFPLVCDTLNFISVECIDGFFLLRFTCVSGDNVFLSFPVSQSCDPLLITWAGVVTEAGDCMGEGCEIEATLTPA